jgi:2-polyprenyl-6-methoxyphenol hydroxylase-like FAD-dependent oxidoreductase
MRVAIVGAGPTGLYAATALARRGHEVTVVDRDPGPAPGGEWQRKGVMQFRHPHGLRRQILTAIEAELPEVRDALLAAGAELSIMPAEGNRPPMVVGMACRRELFELVLRTTAAAEPGVTLRCGHVDDVLRSGGRAAGLRVDGAEVPADLVLNASGRAGRIGDDLRAPGHSQDCGLSYVSRQYELLPGAAPGPVNGPLGLISRMPGYFFAVFLQDNRTLSTTFARPTNDRELAGLRVTEAFEAAARAVPGFGEWIDPARSRPISAVLPGGHLHNAYRGQLDGNGRVALPGLIHVGDAVCTTNPTAGRGITTCLLQVQHLVSLIGGARPGGADLEAVTLEFDRWCTGQIKPWFDDHLIWDAEEVRLWAGEDVDLSRPLASGHIVEAAQADPALMRFVGPYLGMEALPATLAAAEPRAREIYAGGWRAPLPAGPSRDELVSLISRVGV